MAIRSLDDLKKRHPKLKTIVNLPELSLSRRFNKMQAEIDQLKKRVRRLEGVNSPDIGDSPDAT